MNEPQPEHSTVDLYLLHRSFVHENALVLLVCLLGAIVS